MTPTDTEVTEESIKEVLDNLLAASYNENKEKENGGAEDSSRNP